MLRSLIKRSYTTVSVNGITEKIITRNDYPLSKCKEILGSKKTSIIGYGPQGRGQSLNLRDNGFDVSVGVRKGNSFDQALADGWVEGKDLFEVEEAASKGDVIQYLLSDVGQMEQWQTIYPHLTEGKMLYFSHGFGVTFQEKTKINPP